LEVFGVLTGVGVDGLKYVGAGVFKPETGAGVFKPERGAESESKKYDSAHL